MFFAAPRRNTWKTIGWLLLASHAYANPAENVHSVSSPNGRLKVTVALNDGGAPRYWVERDGEQVLEKSRLGLVRDDADFTRDLKLTRVAEQEIVRDAYEILTSKRRLNTYSAHRRAFEFSNAEGQPLHVVFQVSDDGAAFRYVFPDTSTKVHRIREEVTSFNFPSAAEAWLQPMSNAKTGWSQTNPSYEEYYQKEIAVGTPSPLEAGWVFPALFRSGENWISVTETALDRDYCGTRLRAESPDGEYTIGFPDPRESFRQGAVLPESTLPWRTPWRVLAIGTLKEVAESNLGVHLAPPPAQIANTATPAPGKASWSWPLLGDAQTTCEVQKRFIDYAAEMGWSYTLIDALWDTQIGYDKVKELVDYARTKGVKVLVWYNSAGDWNQAPQTPRDLLLTKESRTKEFERLKEMGVAGLKIDFFGGDGQSMIAYYHDLLEETRPYGFAINFHGCTLPRGWQRTYPHLMTMESIRGLEFVTFEQANADQEPTHATVLPFTRNLYDPMDFTPVVLDRLPRTERRTTAAFELALSVLFVSGIQHYAEIPEGMAKAPEYVREFLKRVPAVWDDLVFLDGHPGKYVVIARKAGGKWYVAGINGETAERKITLPLSQLGSIKSATLITDGGDPLNFRRQELSQANLRQLDLTLHPHGGFIIETE